MCYTLSDSLELDYQCRRAPRRARAPPRTGQGWPAPLRRADDGTLTSCIATLDSNHLACPLAMAPKQRARGTWARSLDLLCLFAVFFVYLAASTVGLFS